MTKMSYNRLVKQLTEGKTEEDIKNSFASYFEITYDTSDRFDLYTNQVLFEFKYNKHLDNIRTTAAVLAQTLYYIRKLKLGGYTKKPIPPYICLVDQDEAVLTETKDWKVFYTDNRKKYDWDLAASTPDPQLVKDLIATDKLRTLHVYKLLKETDFKIFDEKLTEILEEQGKLFVGDKKVINVDNFEEVYSYWNECFGDSVRDGMKTSKYFVSDIQHGMSIIQKDQNKVVFMFGHGDGKVKKILLSDYEYFWGIYEKVKDPDIIREIIAKVDRLTDETLRRFNGEFFTPPKFAKKALDYISKTIGNEWWKSGEYRMWDMAAGTGNLQYHLPNEALKYCYLSTIYKEDVEHCQRLFPDATCFQYDYLKDDVDALFADAMLPFAFNWKLPHNLQKDLANPKIKWIIFINPPFATSQTAGTSGRSKEDVSDTLVRKVMHQQNLGEVSRELFSQFIFRIHKEFSGKTAYLGLFSTLKYINSNNDQKLRDNLLNYTFKRGFIFSSANFNGPSSNNAFPIGVLIWDLANKKKIEDQEIKLDVFNEDVEKIGVKTYRPIHRECFLNKWIEREPATIVYPPLGGAITVKQDNKDKRDRISANFLASFMCKGNDLQNQNFTAFLSAPYVSAGALSVTPDNFEKAMVIHAVRRIPKATWINDRDQFLKPNCRLPKEFVTDCAIWSLYSKSNQTAALADIKYKGEKYNIHNNFFPILISDLKNWEIEDDDIGLQLTSDEDRFVANWLQERRLSSEAQKVNRAGIAIFRYYFKNINSLRTFKFKIQTWDAGWWQVRMALQDSAEADDLFKAFAIAHTELRRKLLPQIYEYGFLG